MKRGFLLLTSVWVATLPFYATWMFYDRVVAPWDMSGHSRLAFDLWRELTHGHLSAIYTTSNYYPPLFHLAAAPFSIFGGNPDTYCLANWLFLLLTMMAVFLIGREVAGDSAGLVAGILIPACVNVSLMCVQPMTDLCLTAMVCWTLWLMIRTSDLDGRQAHLLGIMIGLGMLAKWSYAFFMTIPILIYLWRYFHDAGPKQFLRRLIITLSWAAIALPWYILSLPRLLNKIGPELNGDVAAREGDPVILSIASLTRYAVILYEKYLLLPLACLLAVGFLVSIARQRSDFVRNPKNILLISSIISGLIVLTFIANKDTRYMMPIVPLIIVIATESIGSMGKKCQRIAVIASVAMMFLLLWYNLFSLHAPMRKSTRVEEMAEWLLTESGGNHIRVCVIPNEWTLNSEALNYALHRRDRKSGSWHIKENRPIDSRQIVITLNPSRNTNVSPNEVEMTRAITQNPEWRIIKTFKRHDGKTIEIRKHSKSVRPS